jgi:hypothetical protein
MFERVRLVVSRYGRHGGYGTRVKQSVAQRSMSAKNKNSSLNRVFEIVSKT